MCTSSNLLILKNTFIHDFLMLYQKTNKLEYFHKQNGLQKLPLTDKTVVIVISSMQSDIPKQISKDFFAHFCLMQAKTKYVHYYYKGLL